MSPRVQGLAAYIQWGRASDLGAARSHAFTLAAALAGKWSSQGTGAQSPVYTGCRGKNLLRVDGGGGGWWPRWAGSRAQGRAAGLGRRASGRKLGVAHPSRDKCGDLWMAVNTDQRNLTSSRNTLCTKISLENSTENQSCQRLGLVLLASFELLGPSYLRTTTQDQL